MTPEALRGLRSRVMRFVLIVAGFVIASHPIQAAAEAWLDVQLGSIPPAWAAILPTGGAMVSALVSWAGSHLGNRGDTYLIDGAPGVAETPPTPVGGAAPAAALEPAGPLVQADGYAIGTTEVLMPPSSFADGFTGGLEFAPDVVGSRPAYTVDEDGVPQPPGAPL